MMIFGDGSTRWDMQRMYIVGSCSILLSILILWGYVYLIKRNGKHFMAYPDKHIYHFSFLQLLFGISYSFLYSFFLFIYFSETLRLMQIMGISLILTTPKYSPLFSPVYNKVMYFFIIGGFIIFVIVQIVCIIIDFVVEDDYTNMNYECMTCAKVHSIIHFVLSFTLIVFGFISLRYARTAEDETKSSIIEFAEKNQRLISTSTLPTLPRTLKMQIQLLLFAFMLVTFCSIAWDAILYYEDKFGYSDLECQVVITQVGLGLINVLQFLNALVIIVQHSMILFVLIWKNKNYMKYKTFRFTDAHADTLLATFAISKDNSLVKLENYDHNSLYIKDYDPARRSGSATNI